LIMEVLKKLWEKFVSVTISALAKCT
jgi:hypothetical protein